MKNVVRFLVKTQHCQILYEDTDSGCYYDTLGVQSVCSTLAHLCGEMEEICKKEVR